MFSKTYYKILSLVSKLSIWLAASRISFNEKSQLFEVSDDLRIKRKVNSNILLIFLWNIFSVKVIFDLSHGDNISEFYVTFVFFVPLACMFCYMVVFWFPKDVCRSANGAFRYLTYFRGKNNFIYLLLKVCIKILN